MSRGDAIPINRQKLISEALQAATTGAGLTTRVIAESRVLSELAEDLWHCRDPAYEGRDRLEHLREVIRAQAQQITPEVERAAIMADLGFTYGEEGARSRRRTALGLDNGRSQSSIARDSHRVSSELARRLLAMADAPTPTELPVSLLTEEEVRQPDFLIERATSLHVIGADRLVVSARKVWHLVGARESVDPVVRIHSQYFSDSTPGVLNVVPLFGADVRERPRSVGGSSIVTNLYLGRGLKANDRHVLSYEIQVKTSIPVASTIFVSPTYAVAEQTLGIQFHPSAVPSAMWRFERLPYNDALDPERSRQGIVSLDTSPVFVESWVNLRTDYCYGFAWEW